MHTSAFTIDYIISQASRIFRVRMHNKIYYPSSVLLTEVPAATHQEFSAVTLVLRVRGCHWRSNVVPPCAPLDKTPGGHVPPWPPHFRRLCYIRNQSVPPLLPAYNMFMGGVDRTDQLRKTYGFDRKSKCFWLRLFSTLAMCIHVRLYVYICMYTCSILNRVWRHNY